MKISTVVEQPDGNYTFQAELTAEQHAFLIEFAIKELIRHGLIPFASAQTATLIPQTMSEQVH